jgi:hypothetical protein
MTLKNTGLFWRQHKTQNTTHTDTTTNKMSHATLPSRGFAPSLSMGRAVAPPNYGAAAPQRHAQAASRWGCAHCCWFACLGRQNKRHQIIERGGVPWPHVAAVFSIYTTTKWKTVSRLEGALEKRQGWVGTYGEDGCPLFGVGY